MSLVLSLGRHHINQKEPFLPKCFCQAFVTAMRIVTKAHRVSQNLQRDQGSRRKPPSGQHGEAECPAGNTNISLGWHCRKSISVLRQSWVVNTCSDCSQVTNLSSLALALQLPKLFSDVCLFAVEGKGRYLFFSTF